jgi:hypothetical protein
MMMRTTLTLEADVARAVQRLCATEGRSLKSVINETLRAGLKRPSQRPRKKFKVAPTDLGTPLLDVSNVAGVLEILEVDE